MKLFAFDPSEYAAHFAEHGYVHIPGGLTPEYLAVLQQQVAAMSDKQHLPEYALGNKQQSLYEFPAGGDYYTELREAVGAVCGFDPERLLLSERHVKAYEANANPAPLAHKDRYATEVAVGFSVHHTPGSKLVLYPYDELEANPFNSSAELRASLPPHRLPELTLNGARRVEIEDAPGDVLLFHGSRIWHLRARPAGTTMLYLKMNAFNCDPLGEDPRTPEVRRHTETAAQLPDEELLKQIPLIGRKVDYFHRRISRDWIEQVGVVLRGESHYQLEEKELQMLRLMDGRRTVGAVLVEAGANGDTAGWLASLRRLANRGVIDLMAAVPESTRRQRKLTATR